MAPSSVHETFVRRIREGIALAASRSLDDESPRALVAFAAEDTTWTPQFFWTVVCFLRYRDLQRWVLRVIQTRVLKPGQTLQELGPEGVVPGMPDWEYWPHGKGCRFTHRLDGTAIDVDFHDGSADFVDAWFFVQYLKSLRTREIPEARLLELLGDPEILPDVLRALAAQGLLLWLRNTNAYCLADEQASGSPAQKKGHGEENPGALSESVREFVAAVKNPQGSLGELPLAVAAADWARVAELVEAKVHAVGPEFQAALSAGHKKAAAAWEAFLVYAWQQDHSSEALRQLHRLNPERAWQVIQASLEEPELSSLVRLARVCDQENIVEFCNAGFLSLTKFAAGELPPLGEEHDKKYRGALGAGMKSYWDSEKARLRQAGVEHLARLLLRNDSHVGEVLEILGTSPCPASAEISLLVLEFNPEHAPMFFRKGLRAEVPDTRRQAAAILGILDEPWSRQELLFVLARSTDRLETAEVRAALSTSADKHAKEALEAWEAKNPRIIPGVPHVGLDQVLETDERVLVAMQQLHDRVLRFRGRVPTSS
jgi:hypothetical protein